MKAFLIICILLATVAFSPFSTSTALELSHKGPYRTLDASTQQGGPRKPPRGPVYPPAPPVYPPRGPRNPPRGPVKPPPAKKPPPGSQ
ncbi:hypothetical protein NC651_037347 [Populus alba x Populus x berolinensis]|nr:hypothetical protein NC651_037347 [Populus alba x Populus x berolinensis]